MRRGLGLHHGGAGHSPSAPRKLADQKKSPVASERDEEVRGLWRWLASRFSTQEGWYSWMSRGLTPPMTRLYARAPKGRRAYGKVPRNRAKNTTLIAAITLEGAMGESVAIEGATDAKAFEAYYVEHFLAPRLLWRGKWWWCSMG